MRRFSAHRVGVDQGSVLMFSDYQDGGAMWTGQGRRELRRAVVFSAPFAAPPAVMVNLSMWDIDRKTNQRVDISAETVTETGFDLVFRTWGDTRVARVRADWQAMGELAGCDEDWELY